jgi:hypothetical protein
MQDASSVPTDRFIELSARLPDGLDLDSLALETKAIRRPEAVDGASLLRLALVRGPPSNSSRYTGSFFGAFRTATGLRKGFTKVEGQSTIVPLPCMSPSGLFSDGDKALPEALQQRHKRHLLICRQRCERDAQRCGARVDRSLEDRPPSPRQVCNQVPAIVAVHGGFHQTVALESAHQSRHRRAGDMKGLDDFLVWNTVEPGSP